MNTFRICRILPALKLAKHAKTAKRSYWRRSLFSELSSAVQSVENRMRDMDREMDRFFDDFNRSSPVKIPRFFSPVEWSRAREIPVVASSEDGRVYRLDIDVQGMDPENITVTLKDRELSIKTRCEENKSDGSKFARENSYSYALPEEVNPDTIRSFLSGGVLTIEAPLPALESKEIPIKISGSDKDNGK